MDARRDHSQQLNVPVLREVVAQLPALPPVIRYYDDFDDTLRSIRNPAESASFTVNIAGSIVSVPFDQPSEHLSELMKQVFLHLLNENVAAGTAVDYVLAGRNIDTQAAVGLLEAGPAGIATVWSGNPPAFSEQQKWSYAAIASFIAGVMPPSAMLGRSWL